MIDLRLAGRVIEQRIAKQIQERYAVVLTANIATDGQHGPRMEGDGHQVTLADMQIYGERHGWLEVKAKSHAMDYHRWKRQEHGIDEPKFQDYLLLQRKTGMPVYLLICQIDCGELLMADLSTLRSCGHPRTGPWRTGEPGKSINWDRRVFAKVGTINIPNEDLTRMAITFDWLAVSGFLSQFELPF